MIIGKIAADGGCVKDLRYVAASETGEGFAHVEECKEI